MGPTEAPVPPCWAGNQDNCVRELTKTLLSEKMSLVQQIDEDNNLTLGALVNATAVFGTSKIDAARTKGFRLVKSTYRMVMSGKTDTEGPIMIGVCANVPAASDLAEFLSNDPQSPQSEEERNASWFIKTLALIARNQVEIPAGPNLVNAMAWMEFEVSYGKNGWSIPSGSALNLFAFNAGSTLTTGTVFLWHAEHFGVWLRD